MHTCTSSCYQQLTFLERYQISAFPQTGRSQTDIADTLNRSKSTILREIYCSSFEGRYDPCVAQVITMTRRKSAERARADLQDQVGQQQKDGNNVRVVGVNYALT